MQQLDVDSINLNFEIKQMFLQGIDLNLTAGDVRGQLEKKLGLPPNALLPRKEEMLVIFKRFINQNAGSGAGEPASPALSQGSSNSSSSPSSRNDQPPPDYAMAVAADDSSSSSASASASSSGSGGSSSGSGSGSSSAQPSKKRKRDENADDEENNEDAADEKKSSSSSKGKSKASSAAAAAPPKKQAKPKQKKKPKKYIDDNWDPENEASGDTEFPFVLDAQRRRRVTVRKYWNSLLVDLREFYEKDGEELPGKKGITLSPAVWWELKAKFGEVDDAIAQLNS